MALCDSSLEADSQVDLAQDVVKTITFLSFSCGIEKLKLSLHTSFKAMRLYMRFFHILLVCAFCATLTSCFKEEPLNAECDIEYAYLHSDDPEATFYQLTDSLVEVYSTDNVIEFGVKEDVDLTALAPEFVLTEGATIEPASGSVHDFSGNTPSPIRSLPKTESGAAPIRSTSITASGR